ncbi:hypothetical protein CFP56_002544 [Quercus suber]|uniref:Uncharacterized protein n=1 Tax=Quercus suber TaxID=58331 RepID=A0AAW0LE02_QUESU
MEQKEPQIEPQSQKASLHQSDADDDDENVKQLNESESEEQSHCAYPYWLVEPPKLGLHKKGATSFSSGKIKQTIA